MAILQPYKKTSKSFMVWKLVSFTDSKKSIKKIKDVSKEQRGVIQSLKKYSKLSGRPFLLGELKHDGKQPNITVVSPCGTFMNSSLAIAADKAFIQKYTDAVGNIDISSSSWTSDKLDVKPIQAYGPRPPDEDIAWSQNSWRRKTWNWVAAPSLNYHHDRKA